MTSFYSSLSGQGDMLPSYTTSSELAANKVYLNQASNTLLYQNLLSDGSLSAQELVEHETGARGETEMGMQMNMDPPYSDRGTVADDSNCSGSISQYHGLSLSLGSQEPSLVHFHSDFNSHYSNMGLGSFISQNMQSQDSNVENVQYLSFDSEKTFNIGNLGSSKDTSFVFSSDQGADMFGNSKYLKAAQDLLDEIVSVHSHCKAKNLHHLAPHGSSRMNVVSKDEISAETLKSKKGFNDLSPSERHDLQNKLTKLSSMLGEVDNRYRHYCHEMQVVASSFESFSGRGAAFPYTSLALKTISQQFRLLRDAIKKQIQATQKALGEQDENPNGPGVLSRLRFVDQQLRKQMAIQQLGATRQPWRPQRGLPETAVSILRAWLFEHFLHPYPKDSEKIALARQTGLSRSQVANWFINARVRLWKPMIEEIYNEELGDDGTNNEADVVLSETPSNYTVNVTQKLAPEDNNASSKMINDTNTSHVFLALGLQHNENDSSDAMAGESRARDASSSPSPVVERLDYYYDDQVNHQNRFDNNHLMSDFVT